MQQADDGNSKDGSPPSPNKSGDNIGENIGDPAAEAFARWLELEKEWLGDGPGVTEAMERDWLERSCAAERAVVEADAAGPQGLAAKLRLVNAIEGGRHQQLLVAQVIAALDPEGEEE